MIDPLTRLEEYSDNLPDMLDTRPDLAEKLLQYPEIIPFVEQFEECLRRSEEMTPEDRARFLAVILNYLVGEFL